MEKINKAWSYRDEQGEHIILSDGSQFYSYHGSRSSFVLDKEGLDKRIENKKAIKITCVPFWVYNIINSELSIAETNAKSYKTLSKYYEKQIPSQNETPK